MMKTWLFLCNIDKLILLKKKGNKIKITLLDSDSFTMGIKYSVSYSSICYSPLKISRH